MARLINEIREHITAYANHIAAGAAPTDAFPDGERLVTEAQERGNRADRYARTTSTAPGPSPVDRPAVDNPATAAIIVAGAAAIGFRQDWRKFKGRRERKSRGNQA